MHVLPTDTGPPSTSWDVLEFVNPPRKEQQEQEEPRTSLWGDPKRSDPVTVHVHTGDPVNEASCCVTSSHSRCKMSPSVKYVM